jgi:cytochrome c biogenesis protein CcmG/thiol:disulfide interchange protein DsbE
MTMNAADAAGQAGSAAGPAGRSAGRLQTVVVIVVTAVVIGVAAFLISGGSGSADGVTKVDLGAGAAAAAPVVGSVPPAFTGVTYDGKPVNLADYAGKPLWLTFGASWCPDCRNEAPDVEATYQANKAKGLNVLAVFISEGATEISGYAKRAGLTFPITVDAKEAIASAYRTMGIPTHFFIGADGKIREIRIGALSKDDMARAVAAIMN